MAMAAMCVGWFAVALDPMLISGDGQSRKTESFSGKRGTVGALRRAI